MSRSARGRGTVLVAEDRGNWRETFCELLEDEGFHALQASCGEELKRQAPQADVIVLDISMPMTAGGPEVRTAGLDVLIELQAQEEYLRHGAIQNPIVRSMWTVDDFASVPRYKDAPRYSTWESRNVPIDRLMHLIEGLVEPGAST